MGNAPVNASDPVPQSSHQTTERESELLFQGRGQSLSGLGSIPQESNREAVRQAFLKHLEETSQQSDSADKLSGLLEETPSASSIVDTTQTLSASSTQMTIATDGKTSVEETDNHPTASLSTEDSKVDSTVETDASSAAESTKSHRPESKAQIEEKENTLMEAIFSCSLTPNETSLKSMVIGNCSLYRTGVALYLENLAKELRTELGPSAKLLLTPDRVEQILLHGVSFFLRSGSPLSLRWLADCYTRCSESFINSNMSILRVWRSLTTPSLHLQVHDFNFENMRELILRHAALTLQCPDYFMMIHEGEMDIELPPPSSVVLSFIQNCQSSTFQQFLVKVFDEIAENAPEDLERILIDVIDSLSNALESRQMYEPHKPLVTGLQFLLSVKSVPSLIRSRPSFFGNVPKAKQQMQQPLMSSKADNAWILQHCSLLGHLLRPTPMDESTFAQDCSHCTRHRLFRSIFSRPATALTQATSSVRQELLEVIDSSSSIITALCRGADVVGRTDMLKWIASVLNANEVRHQQGLQAQLDMLLSIPIAEGFALRTQGLSTDGFNLNVFWVLLKLLEPVKIQKISDLDPFFILKEDSVPLLGGYLKEGRFGDSDEVKKVVEFYKTLPGFSTPSKFPTQLLWLAFRGLRCLFCPAIKTYEALLRKVEDLQSEGISSSTENQTKYETAIGQLLCVQAVIHHPRFLAAWWNFCHLTLTFFARIFLAFDKNGQLISDMESLIASKNYRVYSILNQFTGDSDPSPQLLVLPLAILDDLMECVSFFASLPADTESRRDIITSTMAESTTSMDADLVTAISLFIMRSSGLIRNPHCRWSSGSQPLFPVYMHSRFHSRLDSSEGVISWLIPSVVVSFIDAQKAGYYGRIQQRLIYTRILERALPTPHHAQRLKEYAVSEEHREVFVKFLAMLVESMMWLLEEAMSSLAEIKKRESTEGGIAASPLATGANRATTTQQRQRSTNMDGEDEDDDFDPRTTEEGHNVSEMPFEQLEKLCQSLMDGGLRAIKVMSFVTKICGDFIVSSSLLLPRVVTSLDCCLEHLVGPRCLQLKVSNFDKYNFNPRQLLASNCEIYNHLESADGASGRVLAAICADTRYFKPAVFMKAHKIARREGLLKPRELSDFNELTKLLQEKATEVEEEEHWLAEIWDTVPDEYKDPIMDELMSDPVQLPTSGQIMDRKHIERHLTTEEFDPFNRMLLKKEQLIPQPELRQQIEDFLHQKRTEHQQQ